MSPTPHSSRLDWLIGRSVAGAFVVLAFSMLLFDLALLPFPGYFIIVGFDILEVTLGSAGSNYSTFFACYLYGLAILMGNLYRLLKSASASDRTSPDPTNHAR